MTDLWTEAARDHNAESTQRILATARVATADVWSFLAGSTNERDFDHRTALVADRVMAALNGDVRFYGPMIAGWKSDWRKLSKTASWTIDELKAMSKDEVQDEYDYWMSQIADPDMGAQAAAYVSVIEENRPDVLGSAARGFGSKTAAEGDWVLWGVNSNGWPIKLMIGTLAECNRAKASRDSDGHFKGLLVIKWGEAPGKDYVDGDKVVPFAADYLAQRESSKKTAKIWVDSWAENSVSFKADGAGVSLINSLWGRGVAGSNHGISKEPDPNGSPGMYVVTVGGLNYDTADEQAAIQAQLGIGGKWGAKTAAVGTEYQRVGRGYVRRDPYPANEYGEASVDSIHCTGPEDKSPVHSTSKGYDSECSWCYLGYGHTDDEHKKSVVESNGSQQREYETWPQGIAPNGSRKVAYSTGDKVTVTFNSPDMLDAYGPTQAGVVITSPDMPETNGRIPIHLVDVPTALEGGAIIYATPEMLKAGARKTAGDGYPKIHTDPGDGSSSWCMLCGKGSGHTEDCPVAKGEQARKERAEIGDKEWNRRKLEGAKTAGAEEIAQGDSITIIEAYTDPDTGTQFPAGSTGTVDQIADGYYYCTVNNVDTVLVRDEIKKVDASAAPAAPPAPKTGAADEHPKFHFLGPDDVVKCDGDRCELCNDVGEPEDEVEHYTRLYDRYNYGVVPDSVNTRTLSSRKVAYPTGRSDYKPGDARVGQATPQSDPDLFSSEDLLAEVKYLIAANKRWGSNPLRTMAYRELMRIIEERGDLAKTSAAFGPQGFQELVGRGLVGFPNSEIIRVEVDHTINNHDAGEAYAPGNYGTLVLRTEDGRELSIPKDFRRVQTYERKTGSRKTAFIVVDTDMNPIRNPDNGSFEWDQAAGEKLMGTTPENGYGFPVHDVLPSDSYQVTWAPFHGGDNRWQVWPREGNGPLTAARGRRPFSREASPLSEGLDLYLGGLEAVAEQAEGAHDSLGSTGSTWSGTIVHLVAALRSAAADGLETEVLHLAQALYNKAIHANGDGDTPASIAAARAVVSYLILNKPNWLQPYQDQARTAAHHSALIRVYNASAFEVRSWIGSPGVRVKQYGGDVMVQMPGRLSDHAVEALRDRFGKVELDGNTLAMTAALDPFEHAVETARANAPIKMEIAKDPKGFVIHRVSDDDFRVYDVEPQAPGGLLPPSKIGRPGVPVATVDLDGRVTMLSSKTGEGDLLVCDECGEEFANEEERKAHTHEKKESSKTADFDRGTSISNEEGRKADASTIMDQIGRMMLGSIGARDYVSLGDGLMFRVGIGNPLRKVIIKLNAKDYYDVEVGHLKRSTYDWIVDGQARDVDASQLGETIYRLFNKAHEGKVANSEEGYGNNADPGAGEGGEGGAPSGAAPVGAGPEAAGPPPQAQPATVAQTTKPRGAMPGAEPQPAMGAM